MSIDLEHWRRVFLLLTRNVQHVTKRNDVTYASIFKVWEVTMATMTILLRLSLLSLPSMVLMMLKTI